MEAETKKAAYRLDPMGYVDRLRMAESERRVSLRPAPDVMARLVTAVPVAQGVAAYAALVRAADAGHAAGDPRSRGQIMADTLVERVTGQQVAFDTPVEVCLVMTDAALLGRGLDSEPVPGSPGDRSDAQQAGIDQRDGGVDEPAEVLGYGPVPAAWARELLGGLAPDVRAWVRRLYLHPTSRQLIAADSKRRCFGPALRKLITIRDGGICRTPWCGAPIRHIDHVEPAAHDGPTSLANGQGLCEACNYAKQAPGWRAAVSDPDAGTVTITTPTGHEYADDPPQVPGGGDAGNCGIDGSGSGPPGPLRSVA